MRTTKHGAPILTCLNTFMAWQNKQYCFPSQDRICRFLKEELGCQLSRRQLNRHLKVMAMEGIIRRVRRHCRKEGFGMFFHSTLYFITEKGWKLLYRWKMISKKRLVYMLKSIRAKFKRMFSPKQSAERKSSLTGMSDLLQEVLPALK